MNFNSVNRRIQSALRFRAPKPASHDGAGCRARMRNRLRVEQLEARVLLSESASAQLSLTSTTGTTANPVYHYDITVTDTGTTNVGTFWFGWVPGEDFLPSVPLSESSPAGWGSAVTGSGNQIDGSAIQWIASSNAITPSHSLSGFAFTTPDSPAALAGKSPDYPSTDVLTSNIYGGAPFSDGGFQFTVTPAVTLAASTTTVVPSQSTIDQGGSVTFTATVAPSSGSGAAATGTVTFFQDGNSLGAIPLQNGTAAVNTSSLPSGALSITAQYSGDGTYSGSTSTAVTETVNPPGATTTTLTTSNPTVLSGTSVTFTATVAPVMPTGTAPTGTVSFSQGGDLLGMVALQPDGTAQFATSSLPIGADPISASYSGDTLFAGSATTSALTETVNPGSASTTSALAASAPSAQSGTSVTFTATVTAVTPGGAVPTGTVTFSEDGNPIGSQPVQSNGTAALSSATLPVGSDSITATYSGDATYAVSTSTSISETITTPGTLIPTITTSTLPVTLVADSATHGTVTLDITNSTANTVKGKVTLEVFASADGTIDSSAIKLTQVTRAIHVTTAGILKISLPVRITATELPTGSYTLLARVIDPSGNDNDSSAGPALSAAAPFVALLETITRMTIPSSAAAGARSHAVVILQINNSGNITTPVTTTVALFATLSGIVDSTATQISSVIKPLRIRAGKSVLLTIPVKQIPAIAVGPYTIVAQVTDPNGQVTTATGGVVNIVTAVQAPSDPSTPTPQPIDYP